MECVDEKILTPLLQIPDYYENCIYLYDNNHFVVKHKLTKLVSGYNCKLVQPIITAMNSQDLMSTDILLIWTTNEVWFLLSQSDLKITVKFSRFICGPAVKLM